MPKCATCSDIGFIRVDRVPDRYKNRRCAWYRCPDCNPGTGPGLIERGKHRWNRLMKGKK